MDEHVNNHVNNLDVVALIDDLPHENLRRGHVGTVVEQLAEDTVEVEFSDAEGRAYALLPIAKSKLMVLHYEPVRAA